MVSFSLLTWYTIDNVLLNETGLDRVRIIMSCFVQDRR